MLEAELSALKREFPDEEILEMTINGHVHEDTETILEEEHSIGNAFDLWFRGCCPWRNALSSNQEMPPCPNYDWIGLEEKIEYGVLNDDLRANYRVKSQKTDGSLIKLSDGSYFPKKLDMILTGYKVMRNKRYFFRRELTLVAYDSENDFYFGPMFVVDYETKMKRIRKVKIPYFDSYQGDYTQVLMPISNDEMDKILKEVDKNSDAFDREIIDQHSTTWYTPKRKVKGISELPRQKQIEMIDAYDGHAIFNKILNDYMKKQIKEREDFVYRGMKSIKGDRPTHPRISAKPNMWSDGIIYPKENHSGFYLSGGIVLTDEQKDKLTEEIKKAVLNDNFDYRRNYRVKTRVEDRYEWWRGTKPRDWSYRIVDKYESPDEIGISHKTRVRIASYPVWRIMQAHGRGIQSALAQTNEDRGHYIDVYLNEDFNIAQVMKTNNAERVLLLNSPYNFDDVGLGAIELKPLPEGLAEWLEDKISKGEIKRKWQKNASPEKYFEGLTKEERKIAEKEIARGKKLALDDKKRYEDWDSDKSYRGRGKTPKTSEYTAAFKEKYDVRRNSKADAPDYRPYTERPFWNEEYQNFAKCGNCKWWDAYGDGFGYCKAFDFSCKEDHLCDGHQDIVHAINKGEWISGLGAVEQNPIYTDHGHTLILDPSNMKAKDVQKYAPEGWRITQSLNFSEMANTGHYEMKKEYDTQNYDMTVEFVEGITDIVIEQDHHPEIYFEYGMVIVTTWSHDEKTITEKDIILALAIDELYESLIAETTMNGRIAIQNPIRKGKDDKGHFYRWGKQNKYYFNEKNEESRKEAYEKSRKQAAAIFASGYISNPKQNMKDFVADVSKKTGIKKNILEEVYKKGLAAWGQGHRPGVTQHQWARGRVYAFVEKGGPVITKKGKKGPDYKLAQKAGLVKNYRVKTTTQKQDRYFFSPHADLTITVGGRDITEKDIAAIRFDYRFSPQAINHNKDFLSPNIPTATWRTPPGKPDASKIPNWINTNEQSWKDFYMPGSPKKVTYNDWYNKQMLSIGFVITHPLAGEWKMMTGIRDFDEIVIDTYVTGTGTYYDQHDSEFNTWNISHRKRKLSGREFIDLFTKIAEASKCPALIDLSQIMEEESKKTSYSYKDIDWFDEENRSSRFYQTIMESIPKIEELSAEQDKKIVKIPRVYPKGGDYTSQTTIIDERKILKSETAFIFRPYDADGSVIGL